MPWPGSAAPAERAAPGVPVLVREAGGVARANAPASGGVPLSAGTARNTAALWLANASGRAVPSQVRALESWPDGSIRWALVDLLATVPANGVASYTLRADGAPRTVDGPRVRLERGDEGWLIDTGAIRVAIPASGDALATSVVAGERQLSGKIPLPALVVADGPAQAPAPGDVAVETEGPVRTELLLRGRYPCGIAYEARVAAFAGEPAIRLQLTLTSLADEAYIPLRAVTLALPGPFTSAEIGVDGAATRFASLAQPHRLTQVDVGAARLDGGAPGASGDGWARASDETRVVTVVQLPFREEYPKGFVVSRDALDVDLVAGRDDPPRLGRGAAKTVEMWMSFRPRGDGPRGDQEAAALGAPLRALAAARWIVGTGALAQSLDPGAAGAATFLDRLSTAVARYAARGRHERWDDGPPVPCEQRTAERERTGFYGLLNWGDWNFPGYRDHTKGCDAWGNLEYDLTQVLGLDWAATDEPEVADMFVAAARHYRDVDIIHHRPEAPELVGLNHPHKASHFAPEAPQKSDLGHTWLEGLVTHYRLTGEVRSMAAARAMGDTLTQRLAKAVNPRQFGWPMIALAALADATNDAKYRTAAGAFARAALGAYPPTPAAADWKIGILADGFAAVHAVNGDPELLTWLLAYADAYLPERARFADARYALPLGYLAALTGRADLRQAAIETAAALTIGDWGKTLALSGRTGFRLLGPLAGPKPAKPPAVTPARADPPPASAPERPRPSPSPEAPDRRPAR